MSIDERVVVQVNDYGDLMIGDYRLGMCQEYDKIWIDRGGEGGEFSASVFREALEKFFAENF